jgi:hypothetical protein
MLLWTSGAALADNAGWLDAATRSLADADFERLAFLVGTCQHRSVRAKGGISRTQLRSISQRLAVLYYGTTSAVEQTQVWNERLARYRGDDPAILRRCVEISLRSAKTSEDWHRTLLFCRRATKCVTGDVEIPVGMPSESARRVVDDAGQYPLWLVQHAESVLEPRTTTRSTVGVIAGREQWFAEGDR